MEVLNTGAANNFPFQKELDPLEVVQAFANTVRNELIQPLTVIKLELNALAKTDTVKTQTLEQLNEAISYIARRLQYYPTITTLELVSPLTTQDDFKTLIL